MSRKSTSPRNKTVTLSDDELVRYRENLLTLSGPTTVSDIENRTIHQDTFEILDWLPREFVDVLFLDPPYNLTKAFGMIEFEQRSLEEYAEWVESWFTKLIPTLKSTASVYVCGDWRSSAAIHWVLLKTDLIIRNRITWQREKGRGARHNWKNNSEDIWFCTLSDDYTFNVDAVKLLRSVAAPYTDSNGNPKDWISTNSGNYRLTHPSNIWTDLTVPFWSMPENTPHPTQKPEKLLSKVVLASSDPDDLIFDPFLGSGTSSVVAKKLGRRYVGIELNLEYCCVAEKRLEVAEVDAAIQGYAQGVFWERNTSQEQQAARSGQKVQGATSEVRLFGERDEA